MAVFWHRVCGQKKIDLNNNNNNIIYQFILSLFQNGIPCSKALAIITHGLGNGVTICSSIYTKSTPVLGLQCHYNAACQAQDTISQLYNPHCRQVPNLGVLRYECKYISNMAAIVCTSVSGLKL